jgi:opacity protein-like surface antigen
VKKSISLLVLLALTAAASFAQTIDLSAGAGGIFSAGLNGGVSDGDNKMTLTSLNFGGFAFFDATYAELAVSFTGGPWTYKMDLGSLGSQEVKMSTLALGLSLLGKYPLDLGAVSFFPLLGIDYQLVLSIKDEDGNVADSPGDYSALWIKLGAGVDYPLTDALYLRGELLYGIGLASKADKDMEQGDFKANLNHGPTIKIGLGYKF